MSEGITAGRRAGGSVGRQLERDRLELAREDSFACKRDVTRNFEIDQARHGSSRGSRKKPRVIDRSKVLIDYVFEKTHRIRYCLTMTPVHSGSTVLHAWESRIISTL